jgi:putative PEP-CTERM system TPR-repeat lipoprotein
MVMAYIRQNELDKANAVAEEMRQQTPSNAVPEIALGLVAVRRESPAAARAHFEKALALQPGLADAEINIAQTYRLEKRPDQARAVLDRAVERDANNPDLLAARADLERAAGNPAAEIEWLEKLRRAAPLVKPGQFRLMAAYIEQNEAAKAVAVGQGLLQNTPNDAQVLSALGEAQLANKEVQTARSTFEKLVALTSDAPDALVRLARAQATANDVQAATGSLRKALSAQPADRRIQAIVLDFAGRSNQYGAFAAFARELSLSRPDDKGIDEFLGALLLASNRPVEAVRAYLSALDKTGKDNRQATLGLAQAQAQAGDPQTGLKVLRDWAAGHPGDQEARVLLARQLGAAGEQRAAIIEFERLRAELPREASVANDLAWLYHVSGDKRALETAEEAYRMAPKSVAAADTLASILLDRGDTKRALDLLETAANPPAPASPGMKYRLAVALDRVGRRDDARIALDDALAGGTSFPEAKEAHALRMKLGY